MTLVLRAKLCRRLAKLEQEKSRVSASTRSEYQKLIDTVGAQCEGIIATATLQVENTWDKFKKSTMRRIPLLPSRADPSSLHLYLPKSGAYLRNLVNQPPAVPAEAAHLDLKLPSLEETAIHQPSQLANRYFKLADLKMNVQHDSSFQHSRDRVISIAGALSGLFRTNALKTYSCKLDKMILHPANL